MQLWEQETQFWRSLRDLPRTITFSSFSTGLVTFVIVLTVPSLVVFQAASAAGFTAAQTGSWFFAILAMGGVMTLTLSLAYRQPIAGGVSTMATAFLVQSLPGFTIAEASGAYMAHGVLIILLAFSGGYARLLALVPLEIVMGMVAGVLLRFGIGIFTELVADPVLVAPILMVWLAAMMGERHWPRWGVPPVVMALIAGVALSLLLHPPAGNGLRWAVTLPEFQRPVFSLNAFLSLSLPLTLIVLSSQNASGISMLWALGYRAPVSAITLVTGLFTIVTGSMGAQGVSMGAQRTALGGDSSVHADPSKRYVAMVVDGSLLLISSVFSITLVSLLRVLALGMIRAIAGLAMLPMILQALERTFSGKRYRFGCLFALVIAASDMQVVGIGSVFWSLLLARLFSLAVDRDGPSGGPAAP